MDPMILSEMDTENTTDDTGASRCEWTSPYRMTPEAQTALVRELAIDLRETAPASGGASRAVQRVAEGKIPPDVMVVALQLKGHLGTHQGGGKFNVLCLNDAAHTNPDGTVENARGSCAILPPLEGQLYGLPFCAHAHCEHLRRDDWLAFLGAETWQRAQAIVAEMKTTCDAPAPDAPDPLDELAEKVAAEGESAAYDPRVLDAAARERAEDPQAFVRRCDTLKKASRSFSRTRWEKALDAHNRAQEQAAKDAAQQRALDARNARRAEEARAAAERAAERERARAEETPERAAHYGDTEADDDTGVTQHKRPGRTWMERPTKTGRESITLVNSSIVVERDVIEHLAPDDHEGRGVRRVAAIVEGEQAVRRIDVDAAHFDTMEWTSRLGARAIVGAGGRTTRDHLRVAIGRMSAPTVEHRYAFTGYAHHDGRRVYLHATGAIDANGDAPDLRATPGDPGDRYAFPTTNDPDAVREGVGALVEFLALEPATVAVPLLALACRSVLGPSRGLLHLVGEQGKGKSTLAALVAQCFGPSMCKENLPLAWDRVTPLAALHALATIGNAVVPIEDLRAEHLHKADPVLRAVFNGAAGMKGRRDGGVRHEPRPRGTVLSTGEVRLPGASLNARVVTLTLDTHPTPRPDEPGGLCDRAARGDLARGMAAFVRWCLPRVEDDRARLLQHERDAARQWDLGVSARAEEVLGALALGLSEFFSFLTETGALTDAEVEAHRTRALDALSTVAREHGEHVEAEHPVRRALPLLGGAIRSGLARIVGIRPDGSTGAPSPATCWGYRVESGEVRSQGRAVGWVKTQDTSVVYLDGSVAVPLARELAAREHPLPLDARTFGKALHAAGLLVKWGDRGDGKVRVRLGGGVRVDAYAVRAADLDIHTNATNDDEHEPEA